MSSVRISSAKTPSAATASRVGNSSGIGCPLFLSPGTVKIRTQFSSGALWWTFRGFSARRRVVVASRGVTRSAAVPLVIGVTEYVDIPAWRILRLRAKIDTGARSSALHVENIRELGAGRVRFDVRLSRNVSDRRVTVEARVARRGQVRPSSGEQEERIFVAVKVRIGPIEREIELSLVDRGRMIFRMLIGRRALAHAFLVDPGRRYLLHQPSTRKPSAPKALPGTAARAAAAPAKRGRQRLGS